MMFTQDRRIEYSQLSPDKTVSIPELFRFLQDMAVTHTTAVGYSLEKLCEMKRAWILLSTHLVINKQVSYPSSVEIQTWTFDFSKVAGPRAFVIRDKNSGEECASACSMWTYIDTESGRPTPIPEVMVSKFGNGVPSAVSYLRRAPGFDSAELVGEYQIMKRDLDSNYHVNNTKYVEYALEAVEETARIREVEIFYHKPVFLGEKILLFRHYDENGDILVNIKNQDNDTCTYVRFVVE